MSNTERKIEQQFQQSHVGRLTQRHEDAKVSRQQQADIPSQDSTRNKQHGNHDDNQPSN